MKLGLFGCRADSRGLAHQMEAFARWLSPTRCLGIDMTADNLSPYPNDWSGYDNDRLTVLKHSELTDDRFREWADDLDVILAAETFYKWEFVEIARSMNVRTVCQINPEFSQWWNTSLRHPAPPRPDVLLVPTTWLIHQMSGVVHLPHPVDRQRFPFRLRTQADHFVHPAGHPAMGDRAGTRVVVGASARARDIRVTIRAQKPLGYDLRRYPNVTLQEANLPSPADLYADADVIVLPRRYGGQHLGMNEALSSGCPVIITDRFPEKTWQGTYPVATRRRRKIRTQFGLIDLDEAQSIPLAQAMIKLRDNPELVQKLSHQANEYAESISWDVMLPRYMDLLKAVVNA